MTTKKTIKSIPKISKRSNKDSKRKLKKTIIITSGTIVILMVVIIIFISPISKYLIEKYDKKFIGREITMDYAYVNPFTGYVYLDNFRSYELESDSIFLSADGVSGTFSMLKLFSKTYEISELILDQPKGIVIQKGDKHDLNFNDIIEKFTPKKTGKSKSPVHFSILKIKINEGEFHYRESVIPVSYFIKKVNIECSGIYWNADTIAFKFSFLSGSGSGDMKGDFTINSRNLDYHFAVVANKFDLKVLEQYLKDISNYGSFSAFLNADVKAKGNFKSKEDIIASGMLAINDFHFGKNPKEDYAAFEKTVLTINELSPKYHKYSFDSVSVSHPYFKYERYDHLDNLQTMFGVKGSNIASASANPERFNLVIEIARYVKVLAKNFFKSNYKINKLAIYKGDFKFNDYSISEKFSADLNPIDVLADSINKTNNRVKLFLKSGIKPYGNVSIDLSINPNDSSDFDIHYNIQKIPVTILNPYVISYSSFPLDRGTIEIKGKWNVRNGMIKSNNHLVLIDPRLADRIKNNDTKWLPMKLFMFFVRERGNVIDYEIPITGNLKDPKFNFRDVLFDVFTNIFVKPVTTAYGIQVKTIETEIEKSLSLKWNMRSSSLESNQEKFIEKMADFLLENPEEHIAIHPQLYLVKEREYILFFEAKKKYFLNVNHKSEKSFSKEDAEYVSKMSVKDSSFIHYLNEQINDPMIFTVQEKCAKFIDASVINTKINKLNEEREKAFLLYFKEKKVEKQVQIFKNKNVIPYNGFSFYKIEYKKQFPEYLISAYQKMDELDEEEPRKKFREERKKNKKNL